MEESEFGANSGRVSGQEPLRGEQFDRMDVSDLVSAIADRGRGYTQQAIHVVEGCTA
jgi:hypothetical protein